MAPRTRSAVAAAAAAMKAATREPGRQSKKQNKKPVKTPKGRKKIEESPPSSPPLPPQDSKREEEEVIDMLRWISRQPKSLVLGRHGFTQLTCRDICSLNRNRVTLAALKLWCSFCSITSNALIVDPDIFTQFSQGGLDYVREWAQSVTVSATTLVIFPVPARQMGWDLIVVDPLTETTHFIQIGAIDIYPWPCLDTAYCLLANTNCDTFWINRLQKFKKVPYSFDPQDANICHCIDHFSHECGPLPKLDKVFKSKVMLNLLRLVNFEELQAYRASDRENADQLTATCNNALCSNRWLHNKANADVNGPPPGSWICPDCSGEVHLDIS